MRYLYDRSPGAKRRVMHLCGYSPTTGEPTMQPICGRVNGVQFNTTCNFPLGRPVCKRCMGAMLDRVAIRTASI